MKNERILEVLGLVGDEYVWEAVPGKAPKKNRTFPRWAVTAACIALAGWLGAQLFLSAGQGAQPGASLPLLTIPEDTGGGMGFEAYMAYDITDLTNANPWSETAQLSTLPVYQNPLSFDSSFIVSGADFESMEAFLREIAARLGLDTESLIVTDNTPSAECQAAVLEKAQKTGTELPEGYFAPTKVLAEQDGIQIEVDVARTAAITFEPSVPLPESCHFTYDSSFEEFSTVADYLKAAYSKLLDMETPVPNICGGDYNIYAQQSYQLEFYGGAKTLEEEILNYNFYRVRFYCTEDGQLDMIRIFSPELSQKMGDYPILSAAQAQQLLLNGNYITSVPYELPGQEYIARTELIYRTGEQEQFYMPYYRFYVELPQLQEENGLRHYGAYYVPAVEPEYISGLPAWDGSFDG